MKRHHRKGNGTSGSRPKARRTDAEEAPWLVIDPTMQHALLIALLRRYGGTLTLRTDELRATAGVNWTIEGFRTPDHSGTVHIRLRRD